MAGSLGPLDARMDWVSEAFGLASPDVAEFRMQVTAQFNAYIKEMTGAQLSKAEAERLKRGMPNLTDTHENFRRKLDRTMKTVEAKNARFIRVRKALGYDTTFAEGSRYIRVMIPGSNEPDVIPAESLDQAKGAFPGLEVLGDAE